MYSKLKRYVKLTGQIRLTRNTRIDGCSMYTEEPLIVFSLKNSYAFVDAFNIPSIAAVELTLN